MSEHRAAFDAWITDHYGELVAVARRKNYRDPEDTVQAAVAGMLASARMPAPCLFWPWAVSFLRGTAHNAHISAARKWQLAREFGRAEKVSRAASIHGRRRPADRAE